MSSLHLFGRRSWFWAAVTLILFIGVWIASTRVTTPETAVVDDFVAKAWWIAWQKREGKVDISQMAATFFKAGAPASDYDAGFKAHGFEGGAGTPINGRSLYYYTNQYRLGWGYPFPIGYRELRVILWTDDTAAITAVNAYLFTHGI